jgi:multiple sugar transport system substrate-binding protein
MMKDRPDLSSKDFDASKFTSFINYFKDPDTGDVYGIPMEAFVKVYVYRKDLFDDPEVQKAFKEKTGKDLKPATTFEEYAEIADFFTE